MKSIVLALTFIALIIGACSSPVQPIVNTPAVKNQETELPTGTFTPPPSQTPTTEPTTTFTPRPTVDLALVLTPPSTVEYEIDYLALKTTDDVMIMGKQFGQGELAVILAHQGTTGANQRDWEPFARMLAERGYTAATLDFRGRGQSQGDISSTNLLILDMRAMIDHLRESGYKRLVCIGASMGGSACLRAAVEYDLEGLVVIGSMMSNGDPTRTRPEELAALEMPKFFITTENDRYPEIPSAIRSMYEISQEPRLLRVFPGEAHGTEMFNQPYGEQFTAELLAFLEMLR